VQKVAEAIANICSERPSIAAETISVNVSSLDWYSRKSRESTDLVETSQDAPAAA
jgi:hypothetical protein